MSQIIWTENKEKRIFFSDKRSEFVISFDGTYWILSYTDFWTIEGSSFVNIKNSQDEFFAIPYLKNYAEKIFKEYLEQK